MEVVLIIIIFILLVVFLTERKKLINKNIQQTTIFETDNKALKDKIVGLEIQNQKLQKYQVIIDAEDTANQITNFANNQSKTIIDKANEELAKASLFYDETKKLANLEAKEIRNKSEIVMQSATVQASKIIEAANIRAEEIAGSAFEALKKADSLEQTAKAMKNIIEGYGDKYLVPAYTLLDQLADDYSHTTAGEELKKCRERMRLMMQNGTAASCEYVESNRKEIAINFVLDAFNGKVDSIISSLKNDNVGTMQQKIRDAYYLVNNNGKAFRNAIITEEYLSLRIEELKWAATVLELKIKEREEQKEIKDRIREEEKARREYEKALKDAEKEEETLRKAMEKVKKELASASEEQKDKYEKQLQELNEKLAAAEERGQRAISMAQQTKTGHVYIISNIGSFGEDVYKVGMTRRLEPLDRVRELGDASVPFPFDVHSLILSDDAPALEHELHKRFVLMQMNKVNPRKEFFKIKISDIKREIEALGVEAKWTMLAEAREYRETLALEEAIKNKTIDIESWEKNSIDHMDIEIEEPEEIN